MNVISKGSWDQILTSPYNVEIFSEIQVRKIKFRNHHKHVFVFKYSYTF